MTIGFYPDSTGFPASTIVNSPAGNIVATNVQAALNELDSEKLAVTTATSTYSPLSHVHSAITTTFSATWTLEATNVQAAILELAIKKEMNLGTPVSDGMVLSSTTEGVRSWIDAPSGVTDEILSLIYAGLN